MPFTISHAAAVLPLARYLRRRRLLSATVIGTMVPDFGLFLFLPWHVPRYETHSAAGLLTFALPVGLTTYWIYQGLIRTPLLECLPDAAYARSRAFASPADIGSARQWVRAGIGVVVGAITHLIWDAFTHEGARGVRMFPALDDPRIDFAGHQLIGVRLLQDASSLIGLAIVGWIIWRALRPGLEQAVGGRPLAAPERRIWLLAYALAAVAAGAASFQLIPLVDRYGLGLTATIGRVAVAALHGLAVSLVLVSAGLNFRLRSARRGSQNS